MKLYCFGFWDGFNEQKNPVNIIFFKDLFENVFNCSIELSLDINDSDILLETVFENETKIFYKKWKYSFLFSGESNDRYPLKNIDLYTCILNCSRNYKNIVNVPLYIPFIYCNKLESKIINKTIISEVPKKNICAIITNPNGEFRNYFLNKLEQKISIDYAGDYKNNTQKILPLYNSDEFRNKISEYKFIISMENSKEDTYITEKITHGFLANIIPVYWGSPNIYHYFNSERFININSIDEIEETINKILFLIDNPEEYLKIVNNFVYNNNMNQRTLDDIVKDIRNIILPKTFPLIEQIYFVNSPIFEEQPNNRLKKLFVDELNNSIENMSFISPTYKTTITDEIYNKNIKNDLMFPFCNRKIKKSELSLTLNYKAILENIKKNYKDGMFLIFESDIFSLKNTLELNNLLIFLNSIPDSWDLIHIGYDINDEKNKGIFKSPHCGCEKPYRNYKIPDSNFIEDITNIDSKYRLIRKYHTRCTDSFIWSYNGVIKFLNYMNIDTNYGAAFDYYFTNFLENNDDFKHFWSLNTYFIQGSNHGMVKSTIQNDII